jgi:hypothetical protein
VHEPPGVWTLSDKCTLTSSWKFWVSNVPEPMLETSVLLSSHAAFELCLIADLLLLSRRGLRFFALRVY